jgi:hypothetical protein
MPDRKPGYRRIARRKTPTKRTAEKAATAKVDSCVAVIYPRFGF